VQYLSINKRKEEKFMIRVLASDGMDKAAAEKLQSLGYEVVRQFYEPEELARQLKEFDELIVRSATKVRGSVIDAAAAAGRLKLVIRAGVGVENNDVDYAESKGIRVTNTPAASSASVAELAIGHMFSIARHIYSANVSMRAGKWEKKNLEGIELSGKTLGVIGIGRIGRLVAGKAAALGMRVIYTDVMGPLKTDDPYTYVAQEELIKTADFITLHCPAAGKPIIGGREIAMMKDGVYLVNTGRGGLIDEEALLQGLDSGKVAAAARDVFSEEPVKNETLRTHPKISLTPHIGASTAEAQERIGGELVELVTKHFQGS
jgi:D-3-phosphoglycerate dehydrogenase